MTDLENIYDEILEESAIDQFSSRVKKKDYNTNLKNRLNDGSESKKRSTKK